MDEEEPVHTGIYGVCGVCGALTVDETLHAAWHASLTEGDG